MKRKLGFGLILIGFCSVAHAMETQQTGPEKHFGYINTQYQLTDGNIQKNSSPIVIPAVNGDQKDAIYATHEGMRKTLLTIEIGSAIKQTLKDFHECKRDKQKREDLMKKVLITANEIEQKVVMFHKEAKLEQGFFDSVGNLKKLAVNIGKYEDYDYGSFGGRGLKSMGIEKCCAMSVTTGGAKDVGHFRKVIDEGNVPKGSDFTMEGFMSEFALSLDNITTSEYLAVSPASAFDAKNKKLYVQLNIASSVTPETFKRKPLNLTIVLDISGSMNAQDNTGKSRLEWAKDILDQMLEKLTESDTLSIVIFDDKVETLIDAQNKTSKADIRKAYLGLEPRGSTDMYAGVKRGFEHASKGLNKQFENRVILISDAGWNTGNRDNTALLSVISDHANEGIGLTAIGVGEDFNEQVIHAVTMSQGGNYIFVQSGKEMVGFFEEFDYLVTPIAYNFKANALLDNKNAKLTSTYGIPTTEGELVGDFVNVRTLFFAGKGGGAMVLEFSL